MTSKPILDALRLVRRFTGDAFKSDRGYDARKPLNFGRRMAVLKYADKIRELTSQPFDIYSPKRGEKTEAFEYTGQKGYRKFTYALVPKVNAASKQSYAIDRDRPKGSRFTVIDRASGQRYYHIPGRLFVQGIDGILSSNDFIEWLDTMGYGDPSDMDVDELEDLHDEYLIDTYGEDAEFFIIQAGDSYMWSSGGDRRTIKGKIQGIKEKYGDAYFNAANPNSNHYSNWFRGVLAFTDRFDGHKLLSRGFAAKEARMDKYHIKTEQKWRILDGENYPSSRNGHWVAGFTNGRMTTAPMYHQFETRTVPTKMRSQRKKTKKKRSR